MMYLLSVALGIPSSRCEDLWRCLLALNRAREVATTQKVAITTVFGERNNWPRSALPGSIVPDEGFDGTFTFTSN